jgi:hypothetical protein
VRRTAAASALALVAVLAVAGVAAGEGEPAIVADPIEATDAQATLPAATAVLENGTTDLSVRVDEGSLVVWTKRIPCVQQDEATCASGSAETTRNPMQVNGSLTIGPRDDEDIEPVTGLVTGEEARLTVDADAQTWRVVPQRETREFAEDPEAPDRLRELTLERGARMAVAQPPPTVEGAFDLLTVDSEVRVDGDG